MNNYTYEEIEVGHTESFSVTVTEEMMRKFLEITGDVNPLHNDEEYAKGKGNPTRVVYGMLTGSFLSTLAGVYLPGRRSLIQEVKIKYARPVFVGDTLNIEGKVDEKNDTFSLIIIKVVIKNQNNEKVCRATMQVGVTDD